MKTDRKLKAIWSMEAAEDMRALRSIKDEQLLANKMAQEITAEIDSEILKDIYNAMATPIVPAPAENIPINTIKKVQKRKIRSISDDWEIQRTD